MLVLIERERDKAISMFILEMSKKIKNFVAAFLDFWRPSWTDNGYFLTLYSLHGNDHLYKFW